MLNINQIPFDDKDTWDILCEGRVKGCFQLESHLGKKWVKELQPHSIEDLAALISLLRPGCLRAYSTNTEGYNIDNEDELINLAISKNILVNNDGVLKYRKKTIDIPLNDDDKDFVTQKVLDACTKSMTQRYCDRKNSKEKVTYINDALEPVLKDTYGNLCFQEQAIKIAQEIAGFNLQEADTLRKCVSKDSLIMTQNGPRTVEFISKNINNKKYNFKILTVDKNNKLIYKNIKDVWSTGKQEIFELKTTNGYSIKVTKNHKIFTQDGWKRLCELTTDDFVVIPNRYVYKGFSKINENQSLILAYLIGEGTYSPNNHTSPKITNSDPWVLNIIEKALIEEFGKESFSKGKSNNCTNIYLLNVAHNWIKKYIIRALSRHKEIPNIILNSTSECANAFVGSYFTAEGSVNKYHLDISSISISIIRNLQLLILRQGVYSSITIHNGMYKGKPYQSYRLCVTGNENIKQFIKIYRQYICPTKLAALENIKTPKHNNSRFLVPACFIKAVSKHTTLNRIFCDPVGGCCYNQNITYDKANRLNQHLDSELLNDILSADFKFVKISSITSFGEEETYDFAVDDDTPMGFINGILVHNSIGKKKADLMSKLKQQFIDGCVRVGSVSKEQAEEIFSWIRESQRYSFNKSIASDTTVITQNGDVKTVGDINIGDTIETPDGYSNVINKYDHGIQDVYEVELENGRTIKCTMFHKFLCEDGIVRPLHEIINMNLGILCSEKVSKKIKYIRYLGKLPTMDIEVDNESHIFFGNGIATSNSHAVSYSITTYRTAYCKAHYPLQFYCSYLRGASHKPDKYLEIKELVSDARMSEIEICTPVLYDRKKHAYIKNDKIFFGINDIKFVGVSSLRSMTENISVVEQKLDKKIKDWTWIDYLIHFSHHIDSSANEALISGGALDYMLIQRNTMLYEYNIWNELTEKEKEFIRFCGTFNNLIEAITKCAPVKKSGGGCHSQSRSNKLYGLIQQLQTPEHDLNDVPDKLAWMEEKYLGAPINYRRSDAASPEATTTCREFVNNIKLKYAVLVVEIDGVKEIATKRGANPGQKMALISVVDSTGVLDGCACFPEAWSLNKNMLYANNSVKVQGTRSKNGGGLIIEKVWEI